MKKCIYIVCNPPILTFSVLVGLFIVVPQLNNQNYIQPTVTSKLIYFLYASMLLLGLNVLRLITSKRIIISFTKIDITLFILLFYISINRYFIQSHYGFSIRYIELLALSFFYVVLRSISLKNYSWLLLTIVISGIIQTIYGALQLLDYYPSNHTEFKITGSFFNPGPYAGFLVSVWSVALGMYLFKASIIKQVQKQINSNTNFTAAVINKSFQYIPLIGMISIAVVLPTTQSRASWVAALGGSIVLLELKYHFLKNSFNEVKKRFEKALIIIFSILIVSNALFNLYNYKKESSDGRTLIWKISSKMIVDNPIFGLGFDRFKTYYMNYQADYFVKNGETDEALVADNVYYAFNEGLQFVSENGCLGLLFLLIVILVLLKTKAKENHKIECNIAKTGLLTVGIFACFSYPMQILPIKIVLVVLLALLSNLSTSYFNINILENNRRNFLYKTSFLILGILGMYQTFSLTKNIKIGFTTWNNAMNYYQYGDYNTSITEFEAAYPIFKTDGEFLMNYGKALSVVGKPEKAIVILEDAKNYQNNTIIATALGDSYKATRQYNIAEENYKQAINMTPSKFYANYLLAKLYDESNQNSKAVAIAKKLMHKEVKILSTAINEIQDEMKQILIKNKNYLCFKN